MYGLREVNFFFYFKFSSKIYKNFVLINCETSQLKTDMTHSACLRFMSEAAQTSGKINILERVKWYP